MPLRTQIWGVEVRPGDQEAAMKKPGEAGTRQCGGGEARRGGLGEEGCEGQVKLLHLSPAAW